MFNKIRNPRFPWLMLIVIFSTIPVGKVIAQDTSYNKPALTGKWKKYKQQVLHDSTKKMTELKVLIPSIIYDLRYATTDNFMKRQMYPSGTSITFLRSPVAKALQKVQEEMNAKGMGLKIFDAYRPWSVTAKFWELVHDERYVANPSKGSGHNRGIAVDLTIINLNTGAELNMGTGFDNFTDTAHATFTHLPEEILQNRSLLRLTMEKYGFRVLETEWWHFYFPESSKYEILDIDFNTLNKHL